MAGETSSRSSNISDVEIRYYLPTGQGRKVTQIQRKVLIDFCIVKVRHIFPTFCISTVKSLPGGPSTPKTGSKEPKHGEVLEPKCQTTLSFEVTFFFLFHGVGYTDVDTLFGYTDLFAMRNAPDFGKTA